MLRNKRERNRGLAATVQAGLDREPGDELAVLDLRTARCGRVTTAAVEAPVERGLGRAGAAVRA
jgi:hypothetical protein